MDIQQNLANVNNHSRKSLHKCHICNEEFYQYDLEFKQNNVLEVNTFVRVGVSTGSTSSIEPSNWTRSIPWKFRNEFCVSGFDSNIRKNVTAPT